MTTFEKKRDVQQIVILLVNSKPGRPQLNSYCQVCAPYFKSDLEQLEKKTEDIKKEISV